MNKSGVIKARTRLIEAEESFQRIMRSPDYTAFSKAWAAFLDACFRIYAVLETASKPKGTKSYQWFGRKLDIRYADPLLEYMKDARNEDEHGIGPITLLEPDIQTFSPANGGGWVKNLIQLAPGSFYWDGEVANGGRGAPLAFDYKPAKVHLLPVFSKHKNCQLPPPTEHLGKKIIDLHPVNIARLCLQHHKELVEEIERLYP